MAFFVRVTGPGLAPQILHFELREITIGRLAHNHLYLPHPSVATNHARLARNDSYGTERDVLTDLKSETGTFVNDRKIRFPTTIVEGERIQIGPYTLELLDREPPNEVEKGFLDAIEANPRDDEMRSVYGDWLEQAGRADESEFLRGQLSIKAMSPDDPAFQAISSRIASLAPMMPREWRRTVARPPLENCSQIRFEIACPKSWDSLLPTTSPKERFCGSCKKNVHYASTVFEAATLAQQGHCVAVDIAQSRSPNDLEPRPPPPMPGYIAPPSPLPPPFPPKKP